MIAAKRLGAEQIILLGSYPDRIALATEFGATDIVSERGDEAVERVLELTDGLGAHSVLECVGLEQSTLTALHIARAGGAVGRVGLPQEDSVPDAMRPSSRTSLSAAGPRLCARTSRNCFRTFSTEASSPAASSTASARLDDVPDGYRAMNEREAIKVMVTP